MLNKINRFLFLPLFIVSVSVLGCVSSQPRAMHPKKVEGKAGRIMSSHGIAVDAEYDARLDSIIPGYKLLPVTVRNLSLYPVSMDDKLDRWIIVGEKGQHIQAINTLRNANPIQWRELPQRIRRIIDYPEIIPINYTVTFDLLLPEKSNVEYFKQIHYYNATWGQQFIIEKEY